MNELREVEAGSEKRLRCVRQIIDAADETLQLVSSMLDRVLPAEKPERKRRHRRDRSDEKKGAPE